MKSSRIPFNLSPFITVFSLLVICFVTSLRAQQLNQLINGSAFTPGSLDNNFLNFKNFPEGFDAGGLPLSARFVGPKPQVRAAAVQADGKIIIGGTFQIQQRSVSYNEGVGVTVIWKNLARLNVDGTLDTSFMSESAGSLIENGNYDDDPNSKPLIWGTDGAVYSIVVELSGDSYQYVVAGDFLNFTHNNQGNSAPRLRYLVLDALTEDPLVAAAQPLLQLSPERAEGFGFDSAVRKVRRVSGSGLAAQLSVADTAERLALTLVQAPIGTIVRQSDNDGFYRRIAGDGNTEADWLKLTDGGGEVVYYVMGDFVEVFDNEVQPFVVRVDRSGATLKTDDSWSTAPTPNGRVNDLASVNNEIMMIGEFTMVNGSPYNRIVKTDLTGFVDAGFNAGEDGFNANAYAIETDLLLSQVVVVGEFTEYNGDVANRIVRLDESGNRDVTFPAANYGNSSGANGVIRALSRQPDGRLLIAGSFTSYNGIPRSGIARLEADGSLDETFTPKGNGSGILAFSTDIDGGPGTASFFARPIVVGDFTNLYGSSGFSGIARLLGGSFPVVWYHPWEIDAPHVALAGGTTSLNVVATDNLIGHPGYPVPAMPYTTPQAPSEPLFYQWQFNRKNIPGANQSTLDLTDIDYSQAGSYRVLIYNSQYYVYGQTTQLSVVNPFIGVIPNKGITVRGRIAADPGLNAGLGGNFTMKISRLGSASGRLIMGGPGGRLIKRRFVGQFDESGVLRVTIPLENLPPLFLNLEMNVAGSPDDFSFTNGNSTVSDGINTAVITAWNNRWSKATQASDFAGRYNVGLRTDGGDLADTIVKGPITRAKVSQGSGYFSMRVLSRTGVARIVGVLSDGSRFTTRSVVWGDTPGTVPIWIPLYARSGALQGELNIDQTTAGNPVTADLAWTKPAGTTKKRATDTFGFEDVSLTAWPGSGLYVASDFIASLPAGPGNFSLDFDDGIWTPTNGGLSAPPVSQSFTVLKRKVRPVLPNPNSVRVKVNRKAGLVTGGFSDPDFLGGNRRARFQSMILTQGGDFSLHGYYVIPDTAERPQFFVGGSVEGY